MKEWFPHDYNASSDAKVRSLIRQTGASGYGLYWHLVEMMHVERTLDRSVAVDALVIGMNADEDEVTRFLDVAVAVRLVIINPDNTLEIPRVTRNLSDRQDISERRARAAAKRWSQTPEKPSEDANAMHLQCKSNAHAMLIQDNTLQDNKEEVMKKTSLPVRSSSELHTDAPPLTTNTGDLYRVTTDDVATWTALYPAVDVMQELRKMAGWLDANPSRRKTARGIRAFIANWLSKQQDRGNGHQTAAKRTTGDRAMAGSDALGYVADVISDRERTDQFALPPHVAGRTLVAAEVRPKD